jgi:hypothetical protein
VVFGCTCLNNQEVSSDPRRKAALSARSCGSRAPRQRCARGWRVRHWSNDFGPHTLCIIGTRVDAAATAAAAAAAGRSRIGYTAATATAAASGCYDRTPASLTAAAAANCAPGNSHARPPGAGSIWSCRPEAGRPGCEADRSGSGSRCSACAPEYRHRWNRRPPRHQPAASGRRWLRCSGPARGWFADAALAQDRGLASSAPHPKTIDRGAAHRGPPVLLGARGIPPGLAPPE